MNKTKIDWADYVPHTRSSIRITPGYILVWCPEHPNANKGKRNNPGYLFEHRLVMSNSLKRPLKKSEHVHHINGNKADNRIENLQIMSNSEHRKYHMGLLSCEQKQNQARGLIRYAESIKLPRGPIICDCGCGGVLISRDSKGRLRTFILGHNGRNKHWKWGGKVV